MFRSKDFRIKILFGVCAIVAAVQFLSGCASMTPEQEARLEKDAGQQVTCTQGDECEVKWGRAITWVSRISQWKIQTQTDNIIQTYTSVGGSAASSFLVNKVPLGNGVYDIAMISACDNLIACIPNATELKASFNRFVIGAVEQKKTETVTEQAQPEGQSKAERPTSGRKFGIVPAEVTPSIANLLNMDEVGGIFVTAVYADSIASHAGIKKGDIILKYGDKVIGPDPEQLRAAITATPPASVVPITIWRNRSTITLSVQF